MPKKMYSLILKIFLTSRNLGLQKMRPKMSL